MRRFAIFLGVWLFAPVSVYLLSKWAGLNSVWPGTVTAASLSVMPAIGIARSVRLSSKKAKVSRG